MTHRSLSDADWMTVLIFIAMSMVCLSCRGQRTGDVGISRYSPSGFMVSYRNMGQDTVGLSLGAEFLIGGSMMQVTDFTSPTSQSWRHLILGASMIVHGPRWEQTKLLAYIKPQALMVIGQEDLPDAIAAGSANLGIVSLLFGFDYCITNRLAVSGEIGPAFEWAVFNGDLDILNEAPLSDRSFFKPLTFGFRFSLAFSDMFTASGP